MILLEDKSIKEIGPDVGNQIHDYWNVVKADNGSIYCLPFEEEYYLKIILCEV